MRFDVRLIKKLNIIIRNSINDQMNYTIDNDQQIQLNILNRFFLNDIVKIICIYIIIINTYNLKYIRLKLKKNISSSFI